MDDATVRGLAREIADSIISDARTLHGPVVWVTGNSYVPPMRSFPQAETVWQSEENNDGELFAFLVEEVERHLDEANVYLTSPDYDNALYAVDTNRWEYDEDATGDDLNDEWRPI